MSIKDFQSKVGNENDALFSALRRISNVANPQKLIDQVNISALGWMPWSEEPTVHASVRA